MVLQKTRTFLELIKIEHSLFALPFAYLGVLAGELPAAKSSGPGHVAGTVAWVTLAMVGIRTVGMCANRLVDRAIDRENPRTHSRDDAIRIMSVPRLWALTAAFLFFYFYSAFRLGGLCFALSPLPALLVFGYPYLKRWTWLSHFVLGIILSCAPVGGWMAAAGTFDLRCLWLSGAVLAWVSGFDILYALQDEPFDRRAGLWSIPVRFGSQGALLWAQALHLVMLAALVGFLASVGFGRAGAAGLAVVAALILRQHHVVAAHGLAKVSEAFFRLNAGVGWILLAAHVLDRGFGV